MANAPPPPSSLPTTGACSDEVMESWSRERGLPDGLEPDAIRAWRGTQGGTVWQEVALDNGCGIDVCEWLKSRGLLDMINLRADIGPRETPLHLALSGEADAATMHLAEPKARWMVANGADVNAVADANDTIYGSIFLFACIAMSFPAVQELADKVTPDHLSMSNSFDEAPMQSAFESNPDFLPIALMLILRGATVRPRDFPAANYDNVNLVDRRRDLLASLEADLRLNDQILIGLFLGCGVHAPHSTPAFATTTTTVNAKRVYTQRPDGGWSAPVSVPCEPRLMVTAKNVETAAQVENHLPKLRGHRNLRARMAIAGFVGVRPAIELGRLRAARDVVATLEEERILLTLAA
jgi:hypothetical protein